MLHKESFRCKKRNWEYEDLKRKGKTMEDMERNGMVSMGTGDICCTTERTPAEQKKLLTRLKTIEGQIRGIQKMVESDAYCPDILMQVSAVSNALNSFNKVLLASHIRGCVSNDIREGNDGKVDELCTMLQKLMK